MNRALVGGESLHKEVAVPMIYTFIAGINITGLLSSVNIKVLLVYGIPTLQGIPICTTNGDNDVNVLFRLMLFLMGQW